MFFTRKPATVVGFYGMCEEENPKAYAAAIRIAEKNVKAFEKELSKACAADNFEMMQSAGQSLKVAELELSMLVNRTNQVCY
jgi:hypothetical protein